jgi:hypothetical protein
VPVPIRELTKADDARRAELLTLAAGTPVALANLRDWGRRFPWHGSNLAQHPGWRMELDRVKSLAYVACPC